MMNTAIEFLAGCRYVEIPSYNAAAFEKRVASMVKRAGKLGADPITVLNLEPFETVRGRSVEHITTCGDLVTRHYDVPVTMHGYVIHGTMPKAAGYTLIGVIEFLGGGVRVGEVPGQTIPEQYRTAQPVCDHCKTRRRRNECVIVRHDDGTYLQVGKACCKDFLGHSFSILTAGIEFDSFISTASDSDEFGFGGGNGPEMLVTAVYLSCVSAAMQDMNGEFVPSSMDSGRMSTRALADITYHRRKGAVRVTDADVETGRRWLEEARSILGDKDLNNYEHNLYLAVKGDAFDSRLAGVVASLPKYLGKAALRQKAADKAPSEFVGTVGKRIDVTLTIQRRFSFETQYGWMQVCTMVDDSGNVFVYKGSAVFCDADGYVLADGATFTCRGTVKAHDVYKGTKQTVLSRVLVLSAKAA